MPDWLRPAGAQSKVQRARVGIVRDQNGTPLMLPRHAPLPTALLPMLPVSAPVPMQRPDLLPVDAPVPTWRPDLLPETAPVPNSIRRWADANALPFQVPAPTPRPITDADVAAVESFISPARRQDDSAAYGSGVETRNWTGLVLPRTGCLMGCPSIRP
jgi:hypothetical protein